jgi:integrase/recombinase XerD
MGLTAMTKIDLPGVTADVDANGNVRYYYRRPGQKKIRLRGAKGSREFMAAYHAAVEGQGAVPIKPGSAVKGSFRALCQAYYADKAVFGRLDESTKAWQRRALDGIAREHGDKPVAKLERKHIRAFRDAKAATPAAANTLLKALRALFSWAEERDLMDSNPALKIKPVPYLSKGFHSWTLEEVEQFEATHAVGTKARLAMTLLLYTACRREDAVRLGPGNIVKGRIRYTQAKNEHRAPVEMDIPIHEDLASVLAKTTLTGRDTFLVTDYGRPFTAPGFGNKFRDWCDQAGLPHCSAHGLRKATAARLAERGASPHEIMSITGHKTLQEVERYTKAAKKAGLADSAMGRLARSAKS